MGRFYRRFYAGRRPLLDAAVYAGIGIELAVSAARGAMDRRTAYEHQVSVSAIVVNHRRRELLAACLDSLAEALAAVAGGPS